MQQAIGKRKQGKGKGKTTQKPSEIVEIWSQAIPHYVQRALQCQDSESLHIFRHKFGHQFLPAYIVTSNKSWV